MKDLSPSKLYNVFCSPKVTGHKDLTRVVAFGSLRYTNGNVATRSSITKYQHIITGESTARSEFLSITLKIVNFIDMVNFIIMKLIVSCHTNCVI